MIKRLVWFATGLATGAGAVVVLGRRLRRRVAELAPVKVAERGVQRVRSVSANLRGALREGADAMRQREDELRSRLEDRHQGGARDQRSAAGAKSPKQSSDSKVIVLRDAVRSSSTRGR